MQQYNSIDEKVTEILKNICDLSEKVTNIIKENQDSNNDEIAITVEEIYNERNLFVNELKTMLDSGKIDVELLQNNPQYERYINEIAPIEEANIKFLNAKTKEKKNKLNELFNNKSLMIYNKKVDLSYENRIL